MVKKTTTANSAAKKPEPRARSAAGSAENKSVIPQEIPDPVRVMGKRDLIDRVVQASGIKKKAAKPVVEAMLRELGDALSRGETLNLQPFGKGIVKNSKDLENAEIIEMRLRRSKQALKAAAATAISPVVDPLAEAAE